MLVAGTLCAAQHWRDYGYVATLARDWRVINVDPLGHGASDTPHDADSYEAAGVTADLVAVLDAEGVDRATVWGYSRGGWLACNLASRYADRVDRIVVAAYAMHAHEEEAGRLLAPLAGFLRSGNWSGLWEALGVTDRRFQQMMQDSNDPLAVAAAIDGSLRPTRFVDPILNPLPRNVLRGLRGLDRAARACRCGHSRCDPGHHCGPGAYGVVLRVR